jgi:osmoprotectant transport system substrate-binding protein
MLRKCACIAALALGLALSACGSGDGGSADGSSSASPASAGPGAGKPPVVLGTKNFTEQFILGELYAQALRAKGWKVELKSDIGSSEVADRALTSGGIDMYPEYTGTTLSVVKGDTMPERSAEATYRRAKAFYEQRGQTLLERTPFEDRDAIAVTRAFARRHGLDSAGDLAKVDGRLKIGGAPEFRTRFAGLEGLRSEYGLTNLTFEPLALEVGDNYKALDQGRVQAADVFTTDPQLLSGKYVVLKDPKAVFGFQNLAPVVDRKVLQTQGRAFAETLDAVSGVLTNDAMRKMNAAVAVDKRPAADVAREFLSENRLL